MWSQSCRPLYHGPGHFDVFWTETSIRMDTPAFLASRANDFIAVNVEKRWSTMRAACWCHACGASRQTRSSMGAVLVVSFSSAIGTGS